MTSRNEDSPPRRRVLIDASTISDFTDGLSVYIVNLIKHLPEESLREFEYTVLLNPGVSWPELTTAIQERGIAKIRAKIAPIGPRRDLDMFRFLRREAGRFDLIHITSSNYPFALRNGVCTIHDVTFKTWFDRKHGIPGTAWLAQAYLTAVVRNCLRNAKAVIAVSASTRNEIERLFGATAAELEKVQVVHEGWEHLAGYGGEECDPFPFEEDGFLFFLGSYRVHKNLGRLLDAFLLALPHIPARKRLVISGSSARLANAHRQAVERINAEGERVVFTGYVSNACVRRLYAQADAFIFPSLAEGFGLPVLEAFYSGAPLLCSRATALPEVAGDAALYFDPEDSADMANAISRFYSEPGVAQALVRAGRERLAAFSWTKAAAETVAVYRQCLGGPGDNGAVAASRVRVTTIGK